MFENINDTLKDLIINDLKLIIIRYELILSSIESKESKSNDEFLLYNYIKIQHNAIYLLLNKLK